MSTPRHAVTGQYTRPPKVTPSPRPVAASTPPASTPRPTVPLGVSSITGAFNPRPSVTPKP